MRIRFLAAALLAGSASLASAQLVGGAAHAVLDPTSGATATLHPSGSAAVDPDPGSDMPTPSIVGHAAQPASAKTLRVSAGAHVQVARETRCYDGTDTWDPTYESDGAYYCETSGPGATIGAKAAPGH